MMKMHYLMALALALPVSLSCNGGNIGGNTDDGGMGGGTPDLSACFGLGCNVDESKCTANNPTSLTGTVYIPAGTLPLYNAKVYIPLDPNPANLPAITPGVDLVNGSCDLCDMTTMSGAVSSAVTDVNGKFTLSPVPVGVAFPLVIKVGKWRRVVMVNPVSTACTSTPLTADQTRLPRNQSEGNIPKIALTTGTWDALECLFRGPKLGLDASEFTNPGGGGSVNLYVGNGTDHYKNGVNGAAAFPSADPWWATAQNLAAYDIVLHSCQGIPNFLGADATAAHTALETYIAKGGRVFASHWHNSWISKANASSKLPTVASFLYNTSGTGDYEGPSSPPDIAVVNQTFAKGMSLAQWLVNANPPGTLKLGQLPIKNSRITLTGRNANLSTSWADLSIPNPGNYGVISPASEYFSFTAPVGAPSGSECGKMVFTDMHVSGNLGDTSVDQSVPNGSSGATPFPSGCTTTSLTPQEQALIFLIFDLTNCVGQVIG
jgi:hypothetical protein